MGIDNGELHVWANKTRGPGVLCHAISAGGLLSLGPLPFSIQYDTTSRPSMQATGRSPQTAPDLWSRVPGAGARGEEGRVEVVSRVYPERVPRKGTRTARPHRRKTALSQSHAHHPYTVL